MLIYKLVVEESNCLLYYNSIQYNCFQYKISKTIIMKVITLRLSKDIENKIRLKTILKYRSVSVQIKKYICDAIVCKDNPNLSLKFIQETLEVKAEIDAGYGSVYTFSIIK